ncbi:MAG: hypothetical protein IPJ20_17700 [Flammeovirgaceae bacterium]|nr:hypothetical protein [Flammeovirgaceae bacterium]
MLLSIYMLLASRICYFENFLDRLILASLKMWDGTDETFKVYFDLMQKWSDNVSANDDVITRRALKIYAALIKARDRKAIKSKVSKKPNAKSSK